MESGMSCNFPFIQVISFRIVCKLVIICILRGHLILYFKYVACDY